MSQFFAIYHGLIPSAPWGVAVARESGSPKVELLMLCRTEKEAEQFSTLTSLGEELKRQRAGKAGVKARPEGGK